MTPQGWTRTSLGALGRYSNGRAFKKADWADSGRPIIRIQNLTGTSDVFNYYRGDDVADGQVARSGDLLVSWAATLGAYIWQGPEAVVNQHIFKVDSYIDVRFHKHLLDHLLSALMRETHGSGMVHITRSRFDSMPVDLPPPSEQRRIVENLEDHLSRLDSAATLLDATQRRLGSMEAAALSSLRQGSDETALGDVTDIQGGIQKQPKRAPKQNAFPFLRVANVAAGRLQLDEVHQVELFGNELDRLRLETGDLLVVEGNGSPSQIGRAALWDGSIADCVHQNHLIRVRSGPMLLPGFLEAVWNSPETRRELTDLSSSSSGLHTLSVSKLSSLRIPVPSLSTQASALAAINEVREARRRLDATTTAAQERGRSLRSSLLRAAFSGRLSSRPAGANLDEECAGV